MGRENVSFEEAAKQYEDWLSGYCTLDPKGLKRKKKKMKDSAFAFLRGTFFHWPHYLTAVDPQLLRAPRILCVGDIHLENYGTWRDTEGRLVWGINDFDEAAELPFTSDLVRLATSARLESSRPAKKKKQRALKLSGKAAIAAIKSGYDERLQAAPAPFVLENHHPSLRDLAIVTGEEAEDDWDEICDECEVDTRTLDASLRKLLLARLPAGSADVHFHSRQAGLGSLGRQRYAAVGRWHGGLVAREAKAVAPSAMSMPRTDVRDPLAKYRRIEALKFRARDPHLHLDPEWVVRRLSPESRKIEIDEIKEVEDQRYLLNAMGRELASMHQGTARKAAHLQKFLDRLPENWLQKAADAAAKSVEREFEAFGES